VCNHRYVVEGHTLSAKLYSLIFEDGPVLKIVLERYEVGCLCLGSLQREFPKRQIGEGTN
jgi:hypothetical protein